VEEMTAEFNGKPLSLISADYYQIDSLGIYQTERDYCVPGGNPVPTSTL